MHDPDLFHRFALASSVAAGGLVVGVGLLLFSPRSWVGRSVVAVAAVAVASGLAALLSPQAVGWVSGGGVAAGTVGVVASLSAVRRWASWCFRPRVIGGAALLAAFGVWGYEAWRFDTATETELDETLARVEVPTSTRTVAHAHTDRGTAVDLTAAADPVSATDLAEMERHSAALGELRVIRRGPASEQANCHGWVFTGGRYHVSGQSVDTILTDNGYSRVTEPAVGDLCIYRGVGGEPSHTGVVRACLPDGTVLAESKWGRLGVYLHEVHESCYGTDFAYYHTARGSHLLNGMDETAGGTVQASEHP